MSTFARVHIRGSVTKGIKTTAAWVHFAFLTVFGWLAYPIDSNEGDYGW